MITLLMETIIQYVQYYCIGTHLNWTHISFSYRRNENKIHVNFNLMFRFDYARGSARVNNLFLILYCIPRIQLFLLAPAI